MQEKKIEENVETTTEQLDELVVEASELLLVSGAGTREALH